MPPKSAFRTTGTSKPKPVAKAKVTPADRARLEWAAFDSWLSVQRKEAEVGKTVKLQELRVELESAKKTIPKGFHSTLMKGYEEKKIKIAKAVQSELVLRSRDEWDERLEKAGLKAEDWDPMTYAEQEAVKAALAGDSDDEDYAPHEIPETVDSSAMHRNAMNVQQTNSYLDVPSLAKRRVPDADRTKSLSPLPDLPDGFRSQTPNRIPPSPSYTPGYTALFSEAKPLGTRYTGPVLVEENKNESPEDADFTKFKMSIREQMIREFHEEAATLEILLVRKEHEAKLEADAIKALVSGHELNMEELRRRKEEKRKATVDAERTKRKAEMRMRNSTPKSTTSMQPDLAAHLENFRKEQRRASAQAQGLSTANETYRVPDELIEETPADVPTNSNQPETSKTETKKQKKGGKASKKAAASRVQQPNSKTDAAPEKQQNGESPAEVARPPEQKTQAKPRGILKDSSTRFDKRPTVEEVSDEEGDYITKPKKESPKQHGNVPTKMFAEPNRAPSTNPFGPDSDDEIVTRFGRVYEPKMKKSAKNSPPKQQFEIPMFSNDEDQNYWDILNGGMGMEQQRGDVSESTQSSNGGTQSSSGGKHAVWAPPSFHEDSADEDEDEGEDSSGLFQSLALGAVAVDSLSSAPWAGGSLYGQFSAPNPKASNVAAKPDPWNKNVSKTRMSMGATQGVSLPNGASGLDSPNWEAAMMGRFFGPTQSYPKRSGTPYL